MNINLIFSGRDRIVLHALPGVLWLASCLYAVLAMFQALPPGVSPQSPMSLKNIAIIGLCILMTYPVYRLGYMALTRYFPDWTIIKRIAAMSLLCVAIGGLALVASILFADIQDNPLHQQNLKWYLLNLFVGMLLMPVFFFIIRGSDIVRGQITGTGQAAAANTLLKKLGPDAGRKLVRMQSADHYVEIHTEFGPKLLLMRLADAIDTLAPINGGQVHRSHWVNFNEVSAVTKKDRKIWLKMSDGAEVPVSRSFRPGLRANGLI